MIFSKSCKYAIRAVLFLSIYSNEEKKFTPKKIAEVIEVPVSFLAKILQKLTKKNLISSARGRKGGFFLTAENNLNPIATIIHSIDGVDKFDECVLGLSECGDEEPCPIHHLVLPMKETLLEELSSKTIQELAKEVENGDTYIFTKYKL